MARQSKIEWTNASWNPIRARNTTTGKVGWHCEHTSPGCVNCYAEGMNKRLGTKLPFKPGHRTDIEIFLDEEMLLLPLRWKQPSQIFVGSMTDVFADFVSDEWLDRLFAVMALCPQHTFQVLTKRAGRMRDYFAARMTGDPWAEAADEIGDMLGMIDGHPVVLEPEDIPLPNVWLGVSAEDQRRADERIPHLLEIPAAVRFLSVEPLLGPIDLFHVRESTGHTFNALSRKEGIAFRGVGLDWVIVGGESGPGARRMHPDWARGLRDQCAAAGVPFFFKQWGTWAPYDRGRTDGALLATPNSLDTPMQRFGKAKAGRLLDGREHNDMPEVAA